MKEVIYSLIPRQHLSEMLKTFHVCTSLSICLLDPNGEVLDLCGENAEFCQCFQPYLPPASSCAKQHADAARLSMGLGESYIFSCKSGLNHIALPLLHHNLLLGSILVGPFLMEAPDSLLLADLCQRFSIPTVTLLELYDASHAVPVIPPDKVTQIARLLSYMFSGLISDNYEQFILNREKMLQQSRINESIQRYKTTLDDQPQYPYETEKELAASVRMKDLPRSKSLLNDLLGFIFFTEGHNLEVIKTRTIELCALLSRAAIEGGAANNVILKMNNRFIHQLQTISDLDALCYALQEILHSFIANMFEILPEKKHDTVKKAMQYITSHFDEPLTLDTVADEVHLNSSYFSTLFKQSTGSSFKEYLNMLRIEESKRLLRATDYSIINIAVSVGFTDQSYFSRIFKKMTGLTPQQYRQ